METAKAAQQAIRRSWCAGEPEKLPELSHPRFARLFKFLVQGKMQVRVLPDEVFGLTLFCHFAREILMVRELQPFLDFSYYYYQKIEQSFSL